MISEKMKKMIAGSSAIRALFEEGKNMAEKHGAENICDFSLGNPNLPPPALFNSAIKEILDEKDPVYVNGYMNNGGYEEVRRAIADHLNGEHGTSYTEKNIIMTVGAAGGLNVTLKTILNEGEEVITFKPYFGEYRNYVANYGGILVEVPTTEPGFMPDLQALEDAITDKTKALIINTPNNPTGVVYSEDVIRGIAGVLEKKSADNGNAIYLISDEPYRELVYDNDIKVPFVPAYYDNTIVGYSFSKSLSLPGERLGYLVVPDTCDDYQDLFDGLITATRISGFVNAPSLMQLAAARCLDAKADIGFYGRNRDMLYNGLTEYGYECTRPEGAFYMWLKSPIEEKEFVQLCKEHLLIVVPGSSFGGPGYIRLAYCIAPEVIEKALPRFRDVMEEIKSR